MNAMFNNPAAARELEALRSYLMRYARAKLNDQHVAEDVVQETMLAALAGKSPFEGRSGLRTWLTSILKHKIIDVYRRQATESRQFLPTHDDESDALPAEDAFHARAEAETRQDLVDPAEEYERRQVAGNVMHAVSRLPSRQRDAFVLVHMHGISGSEAAQRVGVSQCNLWIILHRSRKALQAQLQELRAA